uniref:Uncharacterized protein n=1 Tax=Anguilla anguilla TaxID=7936 RepID=A0A0E9Q949_ANGAN
MKSLLHSSLKADRFLCKTKEEKNSWPLLSLSKLHKTPS